MFDRESARTKSECLSEASTLLSTSIMKEKDNMIKLRQDQLQQLHVENGKLSAMLLDKTAEAAECKALAEARKQQIEEVKETAATWHTLADTLRKDQKELLQMWH
mmetsp:Transcript_18137/g.36570  ORF Transcript_18137/g.36570 Transcript_18137/m.36570 type:complete len:105 (+) Transcript_18137:431-745(+)